MDRALEIEPDKNEAWDIRNAALNSLGKYKNASASQGNLLGIDQKSANILYGFACFCAVQNNIEKSLEKLSQAINLDPQFRENAKKETDFDQIRSDRRFQELLG